MRRLHWRAALVVVLGGAGNVSSFKLNGLGKASSWTQRISSTEDLALARSSVEQAACVHFASMKCRKCRATRRHFERIAREWPDASTGFFEVLVDDSDSNRLAAHYGIKNLPAIRVFQSTALPSVVSNDAACYVSCAARGTGPVVGLGDMREAIQGCILSQEEGGDESESTINLDVEVSPAADLVAAAVPVSLVYVLFERATDILTAELPEVAASIENVAEVAENIGIENFGI